MRTLISVGRRVGERAPAPPGVEARARGAIVTGKGPACTGRILILAVGRERPSCPRRLVRVEGAARPGPLLRLEGPTGPGGPFFARDFLAGPGREGAARCPVFLPGVEVPRIVRAVAVEGAG